MYQICETKKLKVLPHSKGENISGKEYLSTVRAATVRKIAPTAALEAGGNATSSALGSGGSKLGRKISKFLKIRELSSEF